MVFPCLGYSTSKQLVSWRIGSSRPWSSMRRRPSCSVLQLEIWCGFMMVFCGWAWKTTYLKNMTPGEKTKRKEKKKHLVDLRHLHSSIEMLSTDINSFDGIRCLILSEAPINVSRWGCLQGPATCVSGLHFICQRIWWKHCNTLIFRNFETTSRS